NVVPYIERQMADVNVLPVWHIRRLVLPRATVDIRKRILLHHRVQAALGLNDRHLSLQCTRLEGHPASQTPQYHTPHRWKPWVVDQHAAGKPICWRPRGRFSDERGR